MLGKSNNPVTRLIKTLLLVLGLACNAAGQTSQGGGGGSGSGSSPTIITASAKGAALNTNLQTGGGTDDTTTLQNILKPNGSCANVPKGGIQLIIDGPALIHGLTICSNESIVCQPGVQPATTVTNTGGFFFAANSNIPMIALDSSSGTVITESSIAITGCFFNGNRANGNNAQQANGTPNPCMQFYGVSNLYIYNNTTLNCGFTGISTSGTYINEQNNRFEYNPITPLNTGGTDLRGPASYVRIINETVCSGDDAIALRSRFYSSAIDGPLVLGGTVQHVVIDGLNFDCPTNGNGEWGGIDLVSDGSFLLDDVSISHVKGLVQNYAVYFSIDRCNAGTALANGWFGDIFIDDVDVTQTGPAFGTCIAPGLFPVDATVSTIRARNIRSSGIPDPSLFALTSHAFVTLLQTDSLFGSVNAGTLTQTGPTSIPAEPFQLPNGNTLPPPWQFYVGNGQGTNPAPTISSLKLIGPVVAAASLIDIIYGNYPLPSNTQFSEITIPVTGGNANSAEVALARVQVPIVLPLGVSNHFSHYECEAFNGNILLRKWNADTLTTLQTVAQAITSGDKLRIYANGSTIQCIYTPVSTGIPAVIASQTDATFASGTVGVGVLSGTSNTSAVSLWTGGSIPTRQAGLYIANQVGSSCTNAELALSAGWQSTGSATVTGAAGTGQTCSWTITTGTTTAANPTVTDNLTTPLPGASTRCWMFLEYGPASTHTAAAGEGFAQTTLSATAPVFTFNGTPTAAGKTYLAVRTCGP